MASYTGILGDTPELISRKQFGSEQKSSAIAQANPGVVFPLSGGEVLSIPKPSENLIHSLDLDAVTVLIEGKRFNDWNRISITKSMDSLSTVSLGCSFSPEFSNFKSSFVPFTFRQIQVIAGGSLIFTGSIMNIVPLKTSDTRTVTIDAYSLPGVLNDCNCSDPREFLGLGLEQIVRNLLIPFGINYIFRDASAGGIFEKVAISADDKVLGFIVELCKKRRLMITDDEQGRLIFYRPTDVAPNAILNEGESPLVAISPVFDAQKYYSHITGILAASSSGIEGMLTEGYNEGDAGISGERATAINKYAKGLYRPYCFSVADLNGGSLQGVVDRMNRYMLANSIRYKAELNTWLDATGKIFHPYMTVSVTAPGAMIYNSSNFHVRTIALTKEGENQTASLELAVHGSFGGSLPDRLPWED